MPSDEQVNLAVASLQPEVWTSSLNEALSIFITDTKGSAQSFKPTFTYPIFGDAESIFGYKDLSILLCFDAVTFRPFLNVKWGAKLDQTEVDPKTKMLEFLPESTVFKDELKWREEIDAELQLYEIPGKIVGEPFSRDGEQYAIYRLDLASERGIELQKRLQILVLLFIEAGSFIDYLDPLWDVYVMYKVSDPKFPEVVGFTTAYNYWKYPGHALFDEGKVETRKKISQFIVLPIHQGKKLGGEMYLHLYKSWMQDGNVVEIVVEDPSESFDDLRDRVDFTRLVETKKLDLSSLTVAQASDPKWFNELKTKEKLEKRQLQRLLEMAFFYQLSHNIASNTKKAVRLFVKRRLYEKNKEALATLDGPTRLDKLQTAYEALEADYHRILEPITINVKRAAPADEGVASKRSKIQ